MGEPVVLTVLVSHPRAISRRDYLNQEASFSLTADDGTTRKWSGFISSFSRIKTTNDFVSYEIVVKSHLARLQGIRDTKIYQHKTIPQILEAILVRHKFKPHQYLFRLRGVYPFASTVNDASLPELARFLRPQGGLIDTFLATQLAGVIQLQGDQWVPVD
ncbi:MULTISPECIES: contractile injection system protein, VgrG/Pvc8 family [Caballeronia]|uniref:contractile injection system protein, VgrG/Pvc8 family n=1 Tax=Caballeronia TaxID=1827195 RepID=UPI001FD393C9|nr:MULTISPECIES: contractile injection system protein, VgrG/Pvc8 family [Caballeronia]